jgi:hypothetical protein
MGIIRKATSVSKGGMVHYRTANQKTARYAKKSHQLEKRATQGNKPSISLFRWLVERGKKG